MAEREKRLRAKNDLVTFASVIEIPTKPEDADDTKNDEFLPKTAAFGAHHLLWLSKLQDLADGKIKRLLGLMPPGSGKSVYTSVVFPTYFMGRFPKSNVIVASYGSDLPRKFGRRARSIVKQPIYRRIFGTGLSAESTAADEWTLENGSEWMAAGILAGITGNRVDLVVWDDLIKGREQADSEVLRNKTWDAYFDDLLTRKKPYAREVGIITRWHEDDPAGRILPEDYAQQSGWVKGRDGNDWYVVCLPAECERPDDPLGRKVGERLWPEWFPEDHFTSFKMNTRTWSSLYQQRPAPESGDYFQADWIKQISKLPPLDMLTIYGASDYAVSEGKNDYTVHVVIGVDKHDRVYLLDLWRKQASSDVWVEKFCDLVEQYRPMGWAEEAGQIKSGVGPFLVKRLRERHLYIARASFPSRKDKSMRAQAIRGRMAMNGMWVQTGAPWLADFKNELMVFPNGRNDDQVDAISLIGQVLDRMIKGKGKAAPKQEEKVLSTDPKTCTVTLNDLWEANEKRSHSRNLRIY